MTDLYQPKLEDLVVQIHAIMEEFREEYPEPTLTEAPVNLHERLLATQRIRSYMSEQVAKLTLLHGRAKVHAANRQIELQTAEAEAVSKVKVKDFDSAKAQNSRIAAETLDALVMYKRAEVDVANTEMGLNYAREHLRELHQLCYDLGLRMKILSSQG